MSDVENDNIVQGCLFYREPIPLSQPFKEREKKRDRWFEKSLRALNNADIIFLDPDNGIAPFAVTKFHQDSLKYAFIDEIKQYYDLQKSVIIYQHRDFSSMVDFVNKCMNSALDIKPHCFPLFLRFSRVSVRYYMLIARTTKHDAIFTRLFNKLTTDYAFLFGPGMRIKRRQN